MENPSDPVTRRLVLSSGDELPIDSSLVWIVTFFLLAAVAAVLGFGGLAGNFSEMAELMAIGFFALYIAALIYAAIVVYGANSGRNS